MKALTLRKTLGLTLASSIALAGLINTAQAREQINIVGSSTVYPFATLVAEKLGNKGRYKTPVIESTGTGGGMKLFCAGVGQKYPDITNASRAIKSSEFKKCQKNGVNDIVEIAFGNDGIAFAHSQKSPHINLTRQQLWQAMAARGNLPQKWSDIDASLPNTKIVILTPPPTSGTRDAWNAKVMKAGCPASLKKTNKKACKLMREDGAVVEAGENDALIIQKLKANPNSFGIFGFSYLENNSDVIQAATIEGVDISLDNIQSYKYPISRPLFFYVKKAHVAFIPGMKAYLKEFTKESTIGDDGYLTDAGLVPLSKKQRKALRKVAKKLKTIH